MACRGVVRRVGHAELDDRLRLSTLHDQDGLTDANPTPPRLRLYRLPARLAKRETRPSVMAADRGPRPWADAFTTSWHRFGALPAAP